MITTLIHLGQGEGVSVGVGGWVLCVLSCSVVSDSFKPPWTVSHQALLSMEFSRQEYWSGLPFPPPVNLPNPGIKLSSLASAGRFFTTVPSI